MVRMALAVLFVGLVPSEDAPLAMDLARRCEAFGKADSYTAEIVVGGGGGSQRAKGTELPIVCRVQRGRPILFRRGINQLFRVRGSAVFRSGSEEWGRFDRKQGPVARLLESIPIPHHLLRDLLTSGGKIEVEDPDEHGRSRTRIAIAGGESSKQSTQHVVLIFGAKGVLEGLELHRTVASPGLEVDKSEATQKNEATQKSEATQKIVMRFKDLDSTEVSVPKEVLELLRR